MRSLAERLSPDKGESYRRDRTFYGAASRIPDLRDEHELVISGPADTGKTLAMLSYIHDLCLEYPGVQGAIVRKTAQSMPGSVLQTFEGKVLPVKPDNMASHVRAYGGSKPERYIYDNGSQIWVGGMDNPDKVLSSERDFIYVNQLEELALGDWETLGTRCNGRAGNMPFSQMLGDCNPAAPTHWIKSRQRLNYLLLLESFHRDNPEIYDQETGEITEHGKQRLAPLSKLSGARLLRLYKGVWASPEGAIYDVFSEEKHKVAAFPIPSLWPIMVGVDPFGAYVAGVYAAWDPKNETINVYDEYYQPFGLTTPQHVENLLSKVSGRSVFLWAGGGPSERQSRLDISSFGLPLLAPPITGVWDGIDLVQQLLMDSKLVIHDTCAGLLSEIGAYTRKKNKMGEFTQEIENKDGFHLLDALRYLVVQIASPRDQKSVSYLPVSIGPQY